jgi:hypothetical protein
MLNDAERLSSSRLLMTRKNVLPEISETRYSQVWPHYLPQAPHIISIPVYRAAFLRKNHKFYSCQRSAEAFVTNSHILSQEGNEHSVFPV